MRCKRVKQTAIKQMQNNANQVVAPIMERVTTSQLQALWNLPPEISNAVLDFIGDLPMAGLEPEDATVLLTALNSILFKDWNVNVPTLAIANA